MKNTPKKKLPKNFGKLKDGTEMRVETGYGIFLPDVDNLTVKQGAYEVFRLKIDADELVEKYKYLRVVPVEIHYQLPSPEKSK